MLKENVMKKKAKKKKRKCGRLCRCSKCCGGGADSDSDDFIQRGMTTDETMFDQSFEGQLAADSDYSTGGDTDYSYTYQDQKDVAAVQETTSAKSSFVDPEMRSMPDYASMGSYRDITTPDYDWSEESEESLELKRKSSGVSYKKEDKKKSIVTITSKPSKDSFADVQRRLKDLLKLPVFTKTSTTSVEEEEHLLADDDSILEATFSTPPRDEIRHLSLSEFDSSSEVDLVGSRHLPVPPLNLSPLSSRSSFSNAYQKMFQNIKYEVVKETSSSTSTSYEYRHQSRSNASSSSLRRRQNTKRYTPRSTYVGYLGVTIYEIDRTTMLQCKSYVLDAKGYDKPRAYRQKPREYYKNTPNTKSTDNPPVAKMPSSLMKFITKLFHRVLIFLLNHYSFEIFGIVRVSLDRCQVFEVSVKIYCTPIFQGQTAALSADVGNSSLENIDKVSLLSPKSSVTASRELNSDSSSTSRSCRCSSSSTSHSTLMGSTPTKHLRAGAETGTFKENEEPPAPDLNSSDSDITILGATGSENPIIQNQMNSDHGELSPSAKIYSREPPEKDESHTGMRNVSNQPLQRYQSNSETHSKSDSSVLPRGQRNRPEDYFNTSLIDDRAFDSHREYESSTVSNLREATALQRYQPKRSEYAIDDEGTFSESTYHQERIPTGQEGTHHIKHYKSRCGERKYENSNCSCNCNCRKCKCCHCSECHMYSHRDEVQTISCSNSSLNTDFMDLAYQNNNDYSGLVHELEDTLSARNKERVRKTMRQFEYLSKHNKSLEKPIFDDEEEDVPIYYQSVPKNQTSKRRPRSASDGKTNRGQKRECVCCYSRRAVDDCDRRLATAPPDAGYRGSAVSKSIAPKPAVGDIKPKTPICRTKWRMDPRTGEWYKAYDGLDERCECTPQSRHRKSHSPKYHRESTDYDYRSRPERCCGPKCCCCRRSPRY